MPRVSSSAPSVNNSSSGCIEMRWARCVWGATPPRPPTLPAASITRPTSRNSPGCPSATMLSPCTATSHGPTPCGVTTCPPRITRSSMAGSSCLLRLRRGLPLHELRVDLLQELGVEEALGGGLLGDAVEPVEEIDELAHARDVL